MTPIRVELQGEGPLHLIFAQLIRNYGGVDSVIQYIENELAGNKPCSKKDCYYCYKMFPKHAPATDERGLFMVAAGSNYKKPWTKDENDLLIFYNKLPACELPSYLQFRSKSAIATQRSLLRKLHKLPVIKAMKFDRF